LSPCCLRLLLKAGFGQIGRVARVEARINVPHSTQSGWNRPWWNIDRNSRGTLLDRGASHNRRLLSFRKCYGSTDTKWSNTPMPRITSRRDASGARRSTAIMRIVGGFLVETIEEAAQSCHLAIRAFYPMPMSVCAIEASPSD